MGKHSKPTLVRLVGDDTIYLQVDDWKEENGYGFFSLNNAGESAQILLDAACLKTVMDVFVLSASEPHWHVDMVDRGWNERLGVRLITHSEWVTKGLFSDEYVVSEIVEKA